jgi:hypothetical protein
MSIDLLGYAASALVVLTFYMKDMIPLRVAALCSNVCFLAYGGSLHLGPVIVLHVMLIPINVWRLIQAVQRKSASPPRSAEPLRTRAQHAAEYAASSTPSGPAAAVARPASLVSAPPAAS